MRQPTYDEETEILGVFEAAEQGLSRKIMKGFTLAIYDHEEGRDVSIVPESMWDLPEELWDDAPGGLLIGTLDEGFGLALQGAYLWAQHTKEQVVRVAEKATRLWLYHRNILGESVESYARGLSPGDACVVTNSRGEGIGIGVVVGNRLKGRGEAVKPIHDLGQYLRDQ